MITINQEKRLERDSIKQDKKTATHYVLAFRTL